MIAIGRWKFCAWLSVILVAITAVPLPGAAQQPSGSAPAAPAPSGSAPAFTSEQLEQLVAPIALYPDPLLAQVMMASTYPLECAQAARFVKDNPKLQGDQLNEKLKEYDWDDSVKSLVSFPQILSLMDEKLDWVQKLGDAVLAQQKEVLDAVQRLRARAQKEGNLKSTPEQKVTVEVVTPPPPAQTTAPQTVVVQQQPAQVITIEPTNPQVVYVPSYNPQVVYGAWPYPAYPPYYPYPPGYAFGAAALSFGVGMAVGAAVWGNCNWGGGDVDVNVNKNQNFSKNVNRSDVAANRSARVEQGQRGGQSGWKHNPENRRGVQYRDQGTQQRYNRGGDRQAAQSREAFRGRADQGRQELGRGSQSSGRGGQGGQFGGGERGGGQGGGQRGGGQLGGGERGGGQFGGGDRGGGQPGGGDRGGGQFGGGDRGGARTQQVGGGGGRDASAFSGMGGGGGNAKSFSDRGQSSRQSMGASRGGGGGGARATGGGGGGGARGGGGGGRGGGRR